MTLLVTAQPFSDCRIVDLLTGFEGMLFKFPSIDLLDEVLTSLESRGVQLPRFEKSEHVLIFSDYSGERKNDRYSSYSFYVIGEESVKAAIPEIANLRASEIEWHPGSFMEFKKINGDNVRKRILPRFLSIFDHYEGIVLTVLIDKNAPDYFMIVNHAQEKFMYEKGYGDFKVPIRRKCANVLSVLSFLIGRFLTHAKKITWYSDRDDIFGANQSQKNETMKTFQRFLEVFDVSDQKEFQFTFDEHTSPGSDFLCAADLSAGALLDYYQLGYAGLDLRDWTKQIIGWMAKSDTNLKKLMFIGTEEADKRKLILINNHHT